MHIFQIHWRKLVYANQEIKLERIQEGSRFVTRHLVLQGYLVTKKRIVAQAVVLWKIPQKQKGKVPAEIQNWDATFGLMRTASSTRLV